MKDPCYSVPFRCHDIFVCCFFCIGVSRIFTDVIRVIPCPSVAIIICLLFFCIGVSRIFTDFVRVSPCHSVAIIILLVFLHRSITIFTDVVRVTPCHSVAIIISLMSVATITILLNVCKKHSLDLLQPMLLCTFAPNCGIS